MSFFCKNQIYDTLALSPWKPCMVKLEKLYTMMDVNKPARHAPSAAQLNFITEASALMSTHMSQDAPLPWVEIETED